MPFNFDNGSAYESNTKLLNKENKFKREQEILRKSKKNPNIINFIVDLKNKFNSAKYLGISNGEYIKYLWPNLSDDERLSVRYSELWSGIDSATGEFLFAAGGGKARRDNVRRDISQGANLSIVESLANKKANKFINKPIYGDDVKSINKAKHEINKISASFKNLQNEPIRQQTQNIGQQTQKIGQSHTYLQNNTRMPGVYEDIILPAIGTIATRFPPYSYAVKQKLNYFNDRAKEYAKHPITNIGRLLTGTPPSWINKVKEDIQPGVREGADQRADLWRARFNLPPLSDSFNWYTDEKGDNVAISNSGSNTSGQMSADDVRQQYMHEKAGGEQGYHNVMARFSTDIEYDNEGNRHLLGKDDWDFKLHDNEKITLDDIKDPKKLTSKVVRSILDRATLPVTTKYYLPKSSHISALDNISKAEDELSKMDEDSDDFFDAKEYVNHLREIVKNQRYGVTDPFQKYTPEQKNIQEIILKAKKMLK